MAAKKSKSGKAASSRARRDQERDPPSRSKSRAKAPPATEISDLDIEAIGALERFAQYARVALTSLRGGDRAAYVAHLRRVRSSYECIYGHPVPLMTVVREAKVIVDAATLHHSRGGAVDLEGVPAWVTRKAFERFLASTVKGGGAGRGSKKSVVMGVVRLVHARCPHPGAKRLRAEHLTAS